MPTGGDYMLPIDWLKEGVKLTNTLADDVDIDCKIQSRLIHLSSSSSLVIKKCLYSSTDL